MEHSDRRQCFSPAVFCLFLGHESGLKTRDLLGTLATFFLRAKYFLHVKMRVAGTTNSVDRPIYVIAVQRTFGVFVDGFTLVPSLLTKYNLVPH